MFSSVQLHMKHQRTCIFAKRAMRALICFPGMVTTAMPAPRRVAAGVRSAFRLRVVACLISLATAHGQLSARQTPPPSASSAVLPANKGAGIGSSSGQRLSTAGGSSSGRRLTGVHAHSSAYKVRVNFQPDPSFQPSLPTTPSDYVVDSGGTYAYRNGYNYGWSCNLSATSASDVGSCAGPRVRNTHHDMVLDTFVIPDRCASDVNSRCTSGAAYWEIDVSQGEWDVEVVTGDAQYAWDASGCSLGSSTGALQVFDAYRSSTDSTNGAANTFATFSFTNVVLGPSERLRFSGDYATNCKLINSISVRASSVSACSDETMMHVSCSAAVASPCCGGYTAVSAAWKHRVSRARRSLPWLPRSRTHAAARVVRCASHRRPLLLPRRRTTRAWARRRRRAAT